MRRAEFTETNVQVIDAFLAEASFGFLATHRQPHPGITPVNFIWHEGHICFHGSRVGAKMTDFAADPRASFAVAEETTRVPSFFIDPKLACPATAFFRSVIIQGRLEEVTDLGEKAALFAALMKKLQPEGGYAPFDVSDPDYARHLKGTAVLRLRTESLSAKYKFGQNRDEKQWNATVEGLLKRGSPGDLRAVEEMRRTKKG